MFKKGNCMGLAKELNELFRYGRTFSVGKFVEGWGRGVQAARDAFGPYEVVREGGNGEENRWQIVYRFFSRPDELVGVEGYHDSDGYDLDNALFFDVKAVIDDSGIFTVYQKVE